MMQSPKKCELSGWQISTRKNKKSRNGDTLGPVELIVWLEQGNQGDQREQDDQGEVSIIIFGLWTSQVKPIYRD